MQYSITKVVKLSFLIALSVILTRMFSIRIALGGVEGIRLGFGGLPIILAGIAFGPMAGGIVGALADVMGYFINPMGAYMPHFTLASFLTGFIPGAVIIYVFKNSRDFWALVTAVAVGQIITSVIMVPFFLKILFALPYKITFIPRIIAQFIDIPVYAYLIKVLCSRDVVHNNSEFEPIKY